MTPFRKEERKLRVRNRLQSFHKLSKQRNSRGKHRRCSRNGRFMGLDDIDDERWTINLGSYRVIRSIFRKLKDSRCKWIKLLKGNLSLSLSSIAVRSSVILLLMVFRNPRYYFERLSSSLLAGSDGSGFTYSLARFPIRFAIRFFPSSEDSAARGQRWN